MSGHRADQQAGQRDKQRGRTGLAAGPRRPGPP